MKIDLSKKYETVAREGYPSVPVRVTLRSCHERIGIYDVRCDGCLACTIINEDGTSAELPIGPIIQEVKKSVAELIQEALVDPSKCSALKSRDGRDVLLVCDFAEGYQKIGYVFRQNRGFYDRYVQEDGINREGNKLHDLVARE